LAKTQKNKTQGAVGDIGRCRENGGRLGAKVPERKAKEFRT